MRIKQLGNVWLCFLTCCFIKPNILFSIGLLAHKKFISSQAIFDLDIKIMQEFGTGNC